MVEDKEKEEEEKKTQVQTYVYTYVKTLTGKTKESASFWNMKEMNAEKLTRAKISQRMAKT